LWIPPSPLPAARPSVTLAREVGMANRNPDWRPRLSPEAKAELEALKGHRLQYGERKALAEKYGISPARVTQIVGARYQRSRGNGRRRAKWTPGASEVPQAQDVVATGSPERLAAIVAPVEATVSPEDPLAALEASDTPDSLAVLRAIRDDDQVVPETRARAAIALLQHGDKGREASWVPPVSPDEWAGVLVELVSEQAPEVRGLVRLALEHRG